MVPELPSGLSFDSVKGTIQGKAVVSAGPASHFLIGSNPGGTVNCSFVVAVAMSEPRLQYPETTINVFLDAPMIPAVPVACGVDASITIIPDLTTGLLLSSDGIISGIPQVSGRTLHTLHFTGNGMPATLEMVLIVATGPQIKGWIRIFGLPLDTFENTKYSDAFKTAIAMTMNANVTIAQITLIVHTAFRRDDGIKVDYTVTLNTMQAPNSQDLLASIEQAATGNNGELFVATFKRVVADSGDLTLVMLPMSSQAGDDEVVPDSSGDAKMYILIICACLLCVLPYWKRVASCACGTWVPDREPGMVSLMLIKTHCCGMKCSPIAPVVIQFPRARDVESLCIMCESHLALKEVEHMECQFDENFLVLSHHGEEEDIAFENCKANYFSKKSIQYLQVRVSGNTDHCASLKYLLSCNGIGGANEEDVPVETELDALETTVMLPPEKSELSQIITDWSTGFLPPKRHDAANKVFDVYTNAAQDDLLGNTIFGDLCLSPLSTTWVGLCLQHYSQYNTLCLNMGSLNSR